MIQRHSATKTLSELWTKIIGLFAIDISSSSNAPFPLTPEEWEAICQDAVTPTPTVPKPPKRARMKATVSLRGVAESESEDARGVSTA